MNKVADTSWSIQGSNSLLNPLENIHFMSLTKMVSHLVSKTKNMFVDYNRLLVVSLLIGPSTKHGCFFMVMKNQGSIYALDGSHIEHFYILSVSLTSEP